jgi:hypothetical protein
VPPSRSVCVRLCRESRRRSEEQVRGTNPAYAASFWRSLGNVAGCGLTLALSTYWASPLSARLPTSAAAWRSQRFCPMERSNTPAYRSV